MLSCSKLLIGNVYSISDSWFRYKRVEDARMALEQMEGFELAGRTVSLTLNCLFHV